jgi:hypothetical protein
MLARTFYHDVWDPPGNNRTISPGGAARVVAAGVIFHASGEDVQVLITCVIEMSMSMPSESWVLASAEVEVSTLK